MDGDPETTSSLKSPKPRRIIKRKRIPITDESQPGTSSSTPTHSSHLRDPSSSLGEHAKKQPIGESQTASGKLVPEEPNESLKSAKDDKKRRKTRRKKSEIKELEQDPETNPLMIKGAAQFDAGLDFIPLGSLESDALASGGGGRGKQKETRLERDKRHGRSERSSRRQERIRNRSRREQSPVRRLTTATGKLPTSLESLEDDKKGSKTREKNKLGLNEPEQNLETAASTVNGAAPFSVGLDFIPFDDLETDGSVSGDERKGKQRAMRPECSQSERSRHKRDRSHDSYRDRDHHERSRRERSPMREWDRGKPSHHSSSEPTRLGKRKHDMLFDDAEVYDKRHNARLDHRCPWLDGLDFSDCRNVAELFHREVEAFTHWIEPTSVEDEVRGLLVTLITRAVTKQFPDAKVLPFGSFETKLYLPLGDIDLVIISPSMAYSDKTTVLHELANTIKRARIASKVSIIAKTRVPIIKFVTTHGMLKVDMSINQESGLLGGQIVRGFLSDMHGDGMGLALRSLVLVVKAYLSQRSMNEVFTGGLGSYSVVCLAVSFLQMHPKIRRCEMDADKNLGVLLMEFFELYGVVFNSEEVGISVRDGGNYYSKRQRGWYDHYKPVSLSIEDPANPENDVASGTFGFPKVRTTFAGAHSILTSTAYMRANILNSRRSGQSVRLRPHDEPQDLSLLSSILNITQETLNHRRLMKEVYDQKTLHNLVGVEPKPKVVVHDDATNPNVEQNSRTHTNGTKSRPWTLDPSDEDEGEEAEMEISVASTGDEEGGKYEIGSRRYYDPPPTKQKWNGRSNMTHAVFTTDDEEDEDNSDEEEDSEREEGNRGRKSNSGRSKPERANLANNTRRSYWSSKGSVSEDKT